MKHKNKTIKVINNEKRKYINEKISSSKNSKQLYSFFGKLTGKQNNLILPTDTPAQFLPDKFNSFFMTKISNLRTHLDSINCTQSHDDISYSGTLFTTFQSVSIDELKKIIAKCNKSFCELDMLPECLFNECLDIMLPHIITVFNQSLSSGVFPSEFKQSLVIPLLKKPSLDSNVLKNYRPVSNLSFISKVLERIIFNQLISHISNNDLIEKFQSAYKAGHSTETALLRVTNDLLCSIDKGNISMLTLLDLSAAFDTIDHSILLERLSFTFGIKDKALSLIKSYLQERNQKVKINNLYSNELPVSFGVPQGSVLGPLLFTMHIYPLLINIFLVITCMQMIPNSILVTKIQILILLILKYLVVHQMSING